ncbi:trifunctional serine/threonine-protein kinase/ATP-binding protein/sensor histidine kinase [Aliirhizobium cellulosilyticum]|uniref:histidine kinase n=1 Tax=Aliirhizobium cellulosilyticum TaxID=393664 RepID=A0A7W6Y4C9_9HYPH|nr:ATP-binding protein [Rhizobium cellulosilyticum]MBB4349345.1 signal transduction histidine kinase/predicted ATPase [Rhizobium cellulosilyticum]MBB4412433.1 signal transduction histidine kinase/predicted ATPase [Rhizobium cellulosilyticum]MBB4447065.1 signal transduction histidine kinase/predicted ATPase [Rhizobium cellulosilyticum]
MTYVFGNRQIFGRETELGVLQHAYERVSQTGYGEIVLIGGPVGSGKTSVVNAFLAANPTLKFTVGKADQALRWVPYSAVLKAVSALLPPGDIEDITSVRDAGTPGAPNRVRDRLISAIQSTVSPNSPLLLFIDDLHWLDDSSMQLMRTISERGIRDVLLVGTYRTDEAIDFRETGLSSFLGDTAVKVTDILLNTLAYDAVEGLVSAQRYGETSKQLARLVQSVAGGNPFHIQLILNVLDRAETAPDIAHFVSDQKNWGLNSLLSRIVAELPSDTRRIVQLASCIGYTSERTLLTEAAKVLPDRFFSHLEPAVALGLVRTDGALCHFTHDAVREHIRASLSKEERTTQHALLARAMLKSEPVSTDQHLALAEQIVKAKQNPILIEEFEAPLEALIKAAKIAKAVGALDSALRYIEKGIELLSLSEQSGGFNWSLAELRCSTLVEALGSAIDDKELEQLSVQAVSALERARVVRLKAAVLILRGQFEDAIDLALGGLASLGIDLPRRPTRQDLDSAFNATTSALEGFSLRQICEHPRLKDETIVVAMDLLATLQSSFFSDDGLKFLHVAKIVELSARYGVCEATCYGLAWCGVCVASDYSDYAMALSMAEAAVALSEMPSFQAYRTAALVALDQVAVWRRPLSYALSRAREAFEHGKRSGDVSMACYATNHIVSNLLVMGAPLPVVMNEANRGLAMARKVGFEEVIRILQVQQEFANGLRNSDLERGRILQIATSDKASEMSPLVFWGHLYEGITAFYSGQIEAAFEFFIEARKWAWTTPAHIHLSCLHFYSGLCERILGIKNWTAQHREALADYAENNPATFTNKLALIDAEAARAAGDLFGALRFYEQSIQAARDGEFFHELALAHERAGRLSLETGLIFAGAEHIRQAQVHYRKWGAIQHVDRLEAEFAPIFTQRVDNEAQSANIPRLDKADELTNDLVIAAIKFSGAMRGQLIGINGNDLVIIANTSLRDGVTSIASEPSRYTNEMAPSSIIRYVVESAHSLRYGHATAEAGDAHATSLKECPVRSLLCVPLKEQDQVFSILYLENNAVSDAFSYETEQAIELFVLATAEAIRLKAQLDDYKVAAGEQKRRDAAVGGGRADLIKNSHITILGGMAASIVHEVNQPLSAIVTQANAGIRWLRQSPPQVDKAITNFTKIEESSIRASGIVSALRSLAKQAPATLEFFELTDVVSSVLDIVETDARAIGVDIECELAGGTLFADAIQVQQVVLNLMTNALDAMDGLENRRLRISSEVRDAYVVLAVSDTGTGIPATARESIFDPFFTTKGHGLGMGLAICKTIAEVHGGGLSIGASNSSGTTMTFRLPIAAN